MSGASGLSHHVLCICPQDAEEYAELPVRHNEDQLNSQLAQQLPLQVNPHSYDSAHTKTHLLLQAYFSHAQLPCSDYTTDTKTVLDNAIRICQVATGSSSCPVLHPDRHLESFQTGCIRTFSLGVEKKSGQVMSP